MTLEVSLDTLKRGPYIKLKFSGKIIHDEFKHPGCGYGGTFQSAKKKFEGIDISGLVKTNFKLHAYRSEGKELVFTSNISMMTPLPTTDYQVTLNAVCINISKQWVCTHEFTRWIPMHFYILETGTFEVELELMASKSEIVTFAKLYDDTDVADFCLTTTKGSVPVHKACLAAHSDFFKTMFSGQWEETKKNSVELKDVTMTTLHNLKKYLYKGSLPDSDLGPLYLVARCYLIEALKEKCLAKMVAGVTSKNLYDLIGFACENNVPELVIMLLQHTKEEIFYGAQDKSKPQESQDQNE